VADVFISYVSQDRAIAAHMARGLEASGLSVWWDRHIRGGAEFSLEIELELDAASVVVVLWSAGSRNSQWVRDEAAEARDKGKLIPLRLDEMQPPLGFRQVQSLAFASWDGDANAAVFANLVNSIGHVLGNPAPPPLPARIAHAEASDRRSVARAESQSRVTPVGPQKSIAVLPFVNMSSDRENEYLCDGISEELITALSKVPGLRVAARTSSFAFKGKSEDIRAIGERLGVTTVLEGSGRKVGNRLRITAELINIADGFHLWSERYDRELQDVFAIQDDITGAIVEALKVKLAGGVGSAERHTKDIEAYQLYLKGRYFWNLRMAAGLTRAIEFFNQALALDPDYAVALAGLADCYNLANYYRLLPARETFPKAKAAAQKALELNSALAEPHASIGFAKLFYDWDIEGAEAAFERALELDPRYATAHQWYGMCLMIDGRFEEAVAAWRRAQELEPLSLSINASWGWPYYFCRDYDQAIKHFRAALEINPDFIMAQYWLGLAYAQKSMYAEALAELEKANTLAGTDPFVLAALGYASAVAGRPTAALTVLKELNQLAEQRYVSAYDRAVVYAGLRDTEQTLEWLAKAYDEHYSLLVWLKDEPMFDWLRSDPDFRLLLSRIESNA